MVSQEDAFSFESELADLLRRQLEARRQANIGPKVDGKDGQPKLPSSGPRLLPPRKDALPPRDDEPESIIPLGKVYEKHPFYAKKLMKAAKPSGARLDDIAKIRKQLDDIEKMLGGVGEFPAEPSEENAYPGGGPVPVGWKAPEPPPFSREEENALALITNNKDLTPEQAKILKADVAHQRDTRVAEETKTAKTKEDLSTINSRVSASMFTYLASTDPRQYSVGTAKAWLEERGVFGDIDPYDTASWGNIESNIDSIIKAEQGYLDEQARRGEKQAETDETRRAREAAARERAGFTFNATNATRVARQMTMTWDPLTDWYDGGKIFRAFTEQGVFTDEMSVVDFTSAWEIVSAFGQEFSAKQTQALANELKVKQQGQTAALTARQDALRLGDLNTLLQANRDYISFGGEVSVVEDQELRARIIQAFYANPETLIYAQVFGLLDEMEMVLGMKIGVPDFMGMYKDKMPKTFREWNALSLQDPLGFKIMSTMAAAKAGIRPADMFKQMESNLPREIRTPTEVR